MSFSTHIQCRSGRCRKGVVMTYPSDDRNNRDNIPAFMNVLPERLNSLSASELADELELALDYMTEETYDPAVVSAYLDAIDAKAPVPGHPDAEAAYAGLCRRMDSAAASQQPEPEPIRPRHVLRRGIRAGLVAAVMVFCLFSGMIVAQASGMNVFGAIAQWTDSVFVFSNPSSRGNDIFPYSNGNIPPEYEELQAVLQERGLPLYVPNIPEEFVADEFTLYIRPSDETIHFNVLYMNGNDDISYSVIEQTDGINGYYEKDDNEVKIFEYGGVTYYSFQNNGYAVIVWSIDGFEYSLSSNLSSDFLKEIIQSDNQEQMT